MYEVLDQWTHALIDAEIGYNMQAGKLYEEYSNAILPMCPFSLPISLSPLDYLS